MLSPLEVSKFWNVLKALVHDAMPEDLLTDESVLRVLNCFLSGKCQAWLLFDIGGEEPRVAGMSWTRLVTDEVYGVRSCVIEMAYAYDFITEPAWARAYKQIEIFARDSGCSRIVAYSNVARVIEMAEKLGFQIQHVMLAREVNNG